MKRFLKIFILIILTLVVIIAGVITYLVATVDLEQIKQQISQQVKMETGRDLQIKGDLDLSVFPWLGVKIGETHLGNAAGFEGDFAAFSRAEARLKLVPLFSRQVEMSTLIFDGFSLNLTLRKDGINNWTDLAARSKPAAGASAPQTGHPEAPALALFLEGAEIRNANIRFEDHQARSSYALSDLNLTVGQVGLRRDVPFELSFKLKLSEPQLAGNYQLKGITNLDLEAGLVKVRDLKFDSSHQASELPFTSATLGFTTNLVFDQKRQQLEVKPFALRATVKGPELPNQTVELSLETALSFDAKTMAASFKPLNINLPGANLQGDLAFVQIGDKQQIDFSLASEQIDLDRLMVPVPPSDATPAANPAATKPAAPATANAGLRKLMVNGDLKIGKLTRETLLVTDIAMHLKMRDAVLEISPLTAKLYQGLSSSSISADLREAAPKIKANLNLKGFKIGDYLKAAMHKDIIEGTADVNVDLQLTAADTEAIKRSLNGSAAFKVNEGALKGINIPDLIRRARATLAGQPLPPASSQSTDFTELSGTVKIVDGLASNDDLLMKSPLLRIGGKGGVNLPQEQINYLVTAQLVNSLSGQGGAELKDLVGVPLPIRVTGSFSKPEWELDLKTALEARVKAQAKGVLDEALKDPQKVLKDPKSLLEGQKKSIEGLKKLFQ